MKKAVWMAILCLGMFALGQELLVFNDGRTMKIPGPYQIKGNFLQYQDEDGNLLQLPLKLIDVARSKAATEAYHAELAAAAEKAKAEEVEKEPEEKSITEVTEFVQRERPDEETGPKDVSITDDGIDKYRADNPRSEIQQAQVTHISPEVSVSQLKREQQAFKNSYNAIQKEIDELDQQIAATEASITAMQNQLTWGDDPTSSTYDSMVRLEEKLKEFKAERDKKVQEQNRVTQDARKMGIKNVDRPSKQRKKPKRQFRQDLESYESEEGEFEYEEEDYPD